jgi:hypothetical protein
MRIYLTNTNLKGKRIVVAMKSVEHHLQESELGGSVASDNSLINKKTKDETIRLMNRKLWMKEAGGCLQNRGAHEDHGGHHHHQHWGHPALEQQE